MRCGGGCETEAVTVIRVPSHREPTHPGEMLLEEFLKPMSLSQRDFAERVHVPYACINEMVSKQRGITPGTAYRFSQFLGTSADFWMDLQRRWDLHQAGLKGSRA
jgi:antitoxin HigA-1